MADTIGVCGDVYSGSSAVTDLLREFSNTQIPEPEEFDFIYYPDGLEDLEYHLCNYHKYMASVIAIKRFRKYLKWKKFSRISRKNVIALTDNFLEKIVHVKWKGFGNIDGTLRSSFVFFTRRSIFKILRILGLKKLSCIFSPFFKYNLQLSILPQNFDFASKEYISSILDAMGRDKSKITVLDQPFEGCNPEKSFKYFENPKAVIVNRDPRDHYLFTKVFVRSIDDGFQIPCDNVDSYIEYYRRVHQTPQDLKNNKNILFINFEELIYDYENAIKKIQDFTGAVEHINKGEFFKPSCSINNTQVFKKYKGYEHDIEKIEKELAEYIFPFEKYPDVKPEHKGKMFQ